MEEADLTALSDHTADPALLSADSTQLPAELGPVPQRPAETGTGRLVSAGVVMTGASLIGGGALAIAGLIDLIAGGGVLALILLCVGLVLVATHWGWVHVAQAITDAR